MGSFEYYPVGNIYDSGYAYIDHRGFEHLDDLEETEVND